MTEHATTRTLIVDDDPMMVELLRTILADEPDFEVVGQAEDGRSAITMAARLEPDLILLDLVMPMMDGTQALPKLRRACPGARIVVLTMLQRKEDLARAQAAGADGIVDKGLDMSEIVNRLRRPGRTAPAAAVH